MNTVLIILIIVSAILFIAVIVLLILVLKKAQFKINQTVKELKPAAKSVWINFVERGVIITRIITVALLATAIYMWVRGIELDDTLRACLLIVIGFFFNGEITTEIIRDLLKKNKLLIDKISKGGKIK